MWRACALARRQLGALAAACQEAPCTAYRSEAARALQGSAAEARRGTSPIIRPLDVSAPASIEELIPALEEQRTAGPDSVRTGLVGVKVGMVSEWDEYGVLTPLSVLWFDDAQVRWRTNVALCIGTCSHRPRGSLCCEPDAPFVRWATIRAFTIYMHLCKPITAAAWRHTDTAHRHRAPRGLNTDARARLQVVQVKAPPFDCTTALQIGCGSKKRKRLRHQQANAFLKRDLPFKAKLVCASAQDCTF